VNRAVSVILQLNNLAAHFFNRFLLIFASVLFSPSIRECLLVVVEISLYSISFAHGGTQLRQKV